MLKHIVCCYSSGKAWQAEAEIKAQSIEYTTLKREHSDGSDRNFSFYEWHALPYVLGALCPSAAEFLPVREHAGGAQFYFIMNEAPIITQGNYPHENEIMQYSVEVDEKNKTFTARAATRFHTRPAPGRESKGIIRLEYNNVFYYTPSCQLVSFDETIKLEEDLSVLTYFRIPECRQLSTTRHGESVYYEVSSKGSLYRRFSPTPLEKQFGFTTMEYEYDLAGRPSNIRFDKFQWQVEKRLQAMEEAKTHDITFLTPAEIASRCRENYPKMMHLIRMLGIKTDLDDTIFPCLADAEMTAITSGVASLSVREVPTPSAETQMEAITSGVAALSVQEIHNPECLVPAQTSS